MKSISLHDREVVQPAAPAVPAGIHFPHEILDRADLSIRTKREILSAWASDANAVESMPTLRHLPGTPFPVLYSSIMDARERLDREELVRGVRHRGSSKSGSGWDASAN
ncbi:MAG TPA: hypothetical protein VIM56_14010 [Rhizomicrobium sp.]